MHNNWTKTLLAIAGAVIMILVTLGLNMQAQNIERVFNHEQRITTLEESERNTKQRLQEIRDSILRMEATLNAVMRERRE
jgi:hypothetical protein